MKLLGKKIHIGDRVMVYRLGEVTFKKVTAITKGLNGWTFRVEDGWYNKKGTGYDAFTTGKVSWEKQNMIEQGMKVKVMDNDDDAWAEGFEFITIYESKYICRDLRYGTYNAWDRAKEEKFEPETGDIIRVWQCAEDSAVSREFVSMLNGRYLCRERNDVYWAWTFGKEA